MTLTATIARTRSLLLLIPAILLACGGGDKGVAPANPAPVADFTAVSTGETHVCGVAGTGHVYCWGLDMYGELGIGVSLPPCEGLNVPCSPKPWSTRLAPHAIAVAAGDWHSCAIAATGTAYCWGADESGQLGDGLTHAATNLPVEVAGALNFKAITAAITHTCAITTAGDAYCWGRDDQGQLGAGSMPSEDCGGSPCSRVPVLVTGGHKFQQITAHYRATCALTVDGAEYCWGGGIGGSGADPCTGGRADCTRTPIAVAATQTFTAIGMSDYLFCGLTPQGVIMCWGTDPWGMLGDGTRGGSYATPVPAAGGAHWSSFVEGDGHMCALTASGDVECWGEDDAGEVGDGSITEFQLLPVRVASNERFTKIFSGSRSRYTCGLTESLHMMCWGYGSFGQLGDGGLATSATPVQVSMP